MPKQLKHFYEFGPFRLEPHERQLLCGDKPLALTAKAFDMLLVLVENSGHLLDKEELLKKVWPGSFVEEANLSHHIHKLREVLGEGKDGGSYIETVPRRGYRFVAKVIEIHDEPGEEILVAGHSRTSLTVEESQEEEAIDSERVMKRLPQELTAPTRSQAVRRRLALPLVALLILVISLGAYFLWRLRDNRAQANTSGLKSIAVLPFRPIANGTRDETLELGMADTLINRLSALPQLTIRPVSAIRKYADLQQDALEAGRELGVESVLDGSIQHDGNQLRVTVRLLDVSDGATLWAQKFDEKYTDIFAVQDAISDRIASTLALRLNNDQKQLLAKRYTENADAYQLYLTGRYHWNKRTPEGLKASINYFEQAIAKDPSYALAYAGEADALILLPEFAGTPMDEVLPKARALILKALELDEKLAEAHNSLAYLRRANWLPEPVESEFKRAIELNPNYATAHQWYSEYLIEVGRSAESDQEIARAHELDPLSLIINTRIGCNLFFERRYDEALEKLKHARDLDPNFELATVFEFFCYVEKGMFADAIQLDAKSFFEEASPDEQAKINAQLQTAFKSGGERALWQKHVEFYETAKRYSVYSNFMMMYAYLRLGDKSKAMDWLEKLADAKDPSVRSLDIDPNFDSLRSEPRFQAVRHRAGPVLTPVSE